MNIACKRMQDILAQKKLMRGLIFGDMMFLMIGIGGNVKSIIFYSLWYDK